LPQSAAAKSRSPPSAKPSDFQALLDTSVSELQLKTEAHTAWGLGTFDRWNIFMTFGEVTIRRPNDAD
jgi:hypothetical protein